MSPATATATEDEPLLAQRERVLLPLSLLGCVVRPPFALNNLVHERWLLGAAIMVGVLMLAADAWALLRHRPPPVSFAMLLNPASIAVVLSLLTQGIYRALWCYPTAVYFYFALPRWQANLCVLVLLAVAGGACWYALGTGVTIRFVVSMAVMIVALNIILRVLNTLQRQLQEHATRDPLTGACNRREMDARLAQSVARRRRHHAVASLVQLDIDHFKRINDELGHAAGDEVLRRLAALLQARIRKLDTLFRTGGEEFLVLLPDTSGAGAMVLADKLRLAVAQAALSEGRAVTISIGVGELRDDESGDAWLRAVDEARYAAKNVGRNAVVEREPGVS